MDFCSVFKDKKNIKLTLSVFSLITCIIHFVGILSFMRAVSKEDHKILVKRPQQCPIKAHWAAHYWRAEWVWKPAFEVTAWGNTEQLPLCSTAIGLHAFPFLRLHRADFHTAFTCNSLKLARLDENQSSAPWLGMIRPVPPKMMINCS